MSTRPRSALLLTALAATTAIACAHAPPDAAPGTVVTVNAYALVSEPVLQQVEAVGERLAAETGVETFARRHRPVHVTLFMTEFRRDLLPELQSRLATLCASREPLVLRTTGLRLTRGGWLFLDVERTPELVALSTEIASRLAPLRAPGGTPPSWVAAYPEKLESFRRFGSPNVGSQFEPHVTLLASTDLERVQPFLDRNPSLAPPIRGEVGGIALGIADAEGQVVEQAWSCQLTKTR